MQYIYRVLRENEICDKGLGYGIYSKAFDLNNYSTNSFANVLNNYMMRTGSLEFIPCSSNFCANLEKYATAQVDLRPYIAVIENHSSSTITPNINELINAFNLCYRYERQIVNKENYDLINEFESIILNHPILKHCYGEMKNTNILFRYMVPRAFCLSRIKKLKQSDIKKMVVSEADKEFFDELYDFFLRNKIIQNSSIKGKIENDEVLILDHIKQSDFKILNPLQYDILYTLIKNHSISSITSDLLNLLNIFKEENLVKLLYSFSDIEIKYVFQKIYINRYPLYRISKNLSYEKVVLCKKMILHKCIYLLSLYDNKYSNKNIFVLEEKENFYRSPFVKITSKIV